MKLNLQQITSITRGVMRVTEEKDGFHFFRFSDSEQCAYNGTKFETKTTSTAGVEMEFDTDATAIELKVNTTAATTRYYFACDVFVNDSYVGSVKNFDDGSLLCGYAGKSRPQGDFEGTLDLGEGTKRVRVVLPWSVVCVVREMTLVGATLLVPVKSDKKVLLYGDSITHGYDALHPSGSYAARLTRALEAEGFNKAIGGDVFRPALGEADSGVVADIVTVAYGTNDWNTMDAGTFRANCEGFLRALCERQPQAKIFVITPTWRKDEAEPIRVFGPFADVERIMREICELLPVTVVRGYDLVPHDVDNFGDTKLHPNLRGFEFYFNNLLAEMKRVLL